MRGMWFGRTPAKPILLKFGLYYAAESQHFLLSRKDYVPLTKYYAQTGEDYLLNQFFLGKTSGVYIDVGAFDGVHLSNSYCFELMGWKGICVEPQPFYFDICKNTRKGSVCINAACVKDDAIGTIEILADQTGLFSSAKYDGERESMQGHYGTIELEVEEPEHITVPAKSLNSVIKDSGIDCSTLDFISIDVEGLEKDVLEGLDIEKYRPRVFLVETSNNAEDKDEISDYLSSFGYLFSRRVGANSFFVLNEEDYKNLEGIEITCVLEKQEHPLGIRYTQDEYLQGKFLYSGLNGKKLLSSTLITENNAKRNLEKVKTRLEEEEAQYEETISSLRKDLDKAKNDLDKAVSRLKREREKSKKDTLFAKIRGYLNKLIRREG